MADGVGHFADQTPRALRHLHHVVAGLQQLLGEHPREHRIRIGVALRQPVQRGLAGAGGKHREHAFRQRRHRRQPAAAGERAGAGALERIVAAGVEHQDRGPHAAVLQPLDDAVGQHRGVAHQLFLARGRRRHVGRQQIVLAGDLEPVAGEEEERGVAGIERCVERQQALAKTLPRLVLRHHHLEAELLQRIAHGAGVVHRLLQFRDMAIVVVADQQRDALGLGRHGQHQQKCRQRRHHRRPDRSARHPAIPGRRSLDAAHGNSPSCHSRRRDAGGSTPCPTSGISPRRRPRGRCPARTTAKPPWRGR